MRLLRPASASAYATTSTHAWTVRNGASEAARAACAIAAVRDLPLVLGVARELHRGDEARVCAGVLVRELEEAVGERRGGGDRLRVERGVLGVLWPVLDSEATIATRPAARLRRDRRGTPPAGDGRCGRQPVHEGSDRQVAEARARFHPPIVGTATSARGEPVRPADRGPSGPETVSRPRGGDPGGRVSNRTRPASIMLSDSAEPARI